MRKSTTLLIAAALLLPVGSVTVAQTAAPTAEAPAATAAPSEDDQRIRCRRIEITGSLVRRERVCKTVAEWRRLSERGNDVARDIVGSGNVCAGGSCGNGN